MILKTFQKLAAVALFGALLLVGPTSAFSQTAWIPFLKPLKFGMTLEEAMEALRSSGATGTWEEKDRKLHLAPTSIGGVDFDRVYVEFDNPTCGRDPDTDEFVCLPRRVESGLNSATFMNYGRCQIEKFDLLKVYVQAVARNHGDFEDIQAGSGSEIILYRTFSDDLYTTLSSNCIPAIKQANWLFVTME